MFWLYHEVLLLSLTYHLNKRNIDGVFFTFLYLINPKNLINNNANKSGNPILCSVQMKINKRKVKNAISFVQKSHFRRH